MAEDNAAGSPVTGIHRQAHLLRSLALSPESAWPVVVRQPLREVYLYLILPACIVYGLTQLLPDMLLHSVWGNAVGFLLNTVIPLLIAILGGAWLYVAARLFRRRIAFGEALAIAPYFLLPLLLIQSIVTVLVGWAPLLYDVIFQVSGMVGIAIGVYLFHSWQQTLQLETAASRTAFFFMALAGFAAAFYLMGTLYNFLIVRLLLAVP